MINIAIFASGSGSNAQNIAEYFKDSSEIRISIIMANKADAYVIERAKNLDIPSFIFSNKELQSSKIVINKLEELNVDFIVLAGFLLKIPSNLIEKFNDKIINIHPALLPNYGGKGMYGMNVHNSIIENKEKESGISIHLVNENYDEGSIIFQAKTPISKNDTPDDLAGNIHKLEHKHFPEVIEKYVLN